MLSSPDPLSYNSRIGEKAIHLVSNLRDWQSLWKQSKKISKTRPMKKKPNATTAHLNRGNWYSLWKKGLGNTELFFFSTRGEILYPPVRRGHVIFSMFLTCKITDKWGLFFILYTSFAFIYFILYFFLTERVEKYSFSLKNGLTSSCLWRHISFLTKASSL